MSIGEMLRHFLSKLEWFSTLFPRIPVPIQKDLERKLSNWRAEAKIRSDAVSQEIGEEDPEHNPEEGWEDESTLDRSSQQIETKAKETSESSKEPNRVKLDLADEIAREKERQRKEKHGNPSKHHHSSERYKEYSGHSSRVRSRSPVESRSYKNEDTKKHKTKHREKEYSSDHSRHRVHGDGQSKPYRKELSSSEYDRASKEKLHSHDRRKEKRDSQGHNHEKRHKHSSSRTRH